MIRTVVTADKNTLVVTIPEDYIGKQVEVIAFTIEESSQPVAGKRKRVSFNAIGINTTGYKFNREEADER